MAATCRRFARYATRFVRSEDGPTAVEYAVILAAILMVCIASIGTVGAVVADSWNGSESDLRAVFTSGS